jgi:hypothetical protein
MAQWMDSAGEGLGFSLDDSGRQRNGDDIDVEVSIDRHCSAGVHDSDNLLLVINQGVKAARAIKAGNFEHEKRREMTAKGACSIRYAALRTATFRQRHAWTRAGFLLVAGLGTLRLVGREGALLPLEGRSCRLELVVISRQAPASTRALSVDICNMLRNFPDDGVQIGPQHRESPYSTEAESKNISPTRTYPSAKTKAPTRPARTSTRLAVPRR